jgi:UDP-N-acetylmuramoylalanine--D-glutamate ligase
VRFSQLDGAEVGVWGAGREIRSFARQLQARLPGARITVAAFDSPPAEPLAGALARARPVSGEELVPALARCQVVVRSPGVSVHRAELRELERAGVAVTTATSLWLGEHGGRGVIGITGTKGKSTTAALACHLARAAGRRAELAGNIGVPALDLLDAEPFELAVVELSSYQIADLCTGPEVAVVTNLYREHLDWHGSEQAYRADKLRLLTLPGVERAVLGAALEAPVRDGAGVLRFGAPGSWEATAHGVERDGKVALAAGELPLPGAHNALNLCAALTALEAAGIPAAASLAGALAGFTPLPHRLQTVAERSGVAWVNDSISTTPESTLAALACYPGRELVLIAGGQDRGQDFGELARALAREQITLIGVPSTGERLVAAARAAGVPEQRSLIVGDLAEAVMRARAAARPGAVVLLSPAAPSYDSYRDFEQRGERFQALAAG